MRPCQAVAGLGDSKVAVRRVSAQSISFEVLVAVVADGNALLWPRPFSRTRIRPLGLAPFGSQYFSRAGCASGFARGFFLCGGAGRGSRSRLLFGHPVPP